MTPKRALDSTASVVFMRFQVGLMLFLGVVCVTCQRVNPSPTKPESSAVAVAASATVAPSAASETAQKPASGCAGAYQGTYTVSPTKPGISRKEGAPAPWESDDGHALSGPGQVALVVDAQNAITGSAQGALGKQILRGSCEDNTLRIHLDSTGPDSNQIQNAFIVAEITGDQATGTIHAATGDSLVRRSGSVNLRKAQ